MFFDVKNHILHGTEPFCSCAQDEDMAYCMALEAYSQGCRFILATPPADAFLNAADRGEGHAVWERFEALRQRVRESESMHGMDLGLGCEIPCSRKALKNIVDHLAKGTLPTLHGSRFVLLSFQRDVTREELWHCLDYLDQAGYVPVISHIQTIETLKGDVEEIRCLKGEGPRDEKYRFRAVIQLDTLSISEPDYDAWWPEKLIRAGVVDVMATDARNTFTHPPHIREELKKARGFCTQQYWERITWKNAFQWLVLNK